MNPPQEDSRDEVDAVSANELSACEKLLMEHWLKSAPNPWLQPTPKAALEALGPSGGWPTVGDATPKMHPEPPIPVSCWPSFFDPFHPWLLSQPPMPHTWPLGVPRSEEFLSPALRDRIFEAALEFLAGIDLWTPEGRARAAWRRSTWKQN